MGNRRKQGDRSSPPGAGLVGKKTSSANQSKLKKEPEPAPENASDKDSRYTREESLQRPLEQQHLRALSDVGEFSDNEGSPEETSQPPVEIPLSLNRNRGIDCRTVLVSVVVSAVAVALMLLACWRWQCASNPIYIPVGSSEDSKAWVEAIQVMQEQLRREFEGKLAKLHILDASEIQDNVKSTLEPYLDHIKNHLLQDQLKRNVGQILAEISIPSDESIEGIAMNVVKERLELILPEREKGLSQKLEEMEDRLETKIEEAKSPPDDGLKEEVEKLQERVGGLGERDRGLLQKLEEMEDRLEKLQKRVGELEERDKGLLQKLEEMEDRLEIKIEESRQTGTEKQTLLLHKVQYAMEKLQAEASQNYLLSVGSLLLALLALLVACCFRSAKHAASALSSANPPPTQAPNTHPKQVSNPPLAGVSPFLAQLQQREKEEQEAVSQWKGTLERAVCVVHFGQEHRQHHRQLAQGVTQERLLEAAVLRTVDIPKVPGARLYLVFVNFNERNVILESKEQGTGDLRQTTVEALLRRGAEVVVVYAGDKGSGDLQVGHLYNPYLSSVQRHPVLSQLSGRQCVLSIRTEFLQHQRQHLQHTVTAALNRQT